MVHHIITDINGFIFNELNIYQSKYHISQKINFLLNLELKYFILMGKIKLYTKKLAKLTLSSYL
jgi:hypothetical protein